MKKFFEEFKAFALRGNVMDMAIGVIIGGAFTSIVTSLTENLINPILGLFGGTDLSGFVLNLGGVELRYGAFITSIINFLIMAFVLFCLLKAVNRLTALGKKPIETLLADRTEKYRKIGRYPEYSLPADKNGGKPRKKRWFSHDDRA